MSRIRPFHLVAVAAAMAAAAACSKDNTSPTTTQVVSDQQVSSDVVNSAGPAISADIAEINLNDSMTAAPPAAIDQSAPGLTVARHRACYQGATLQVACDSTTTDSVVISDTVTGSIARSFTGPHGSDSMTLAVHAIRHLAISGLAGHETARTHNGFGADNDTTQFTATSDSTTRSRTMMESDNDSVQALVDSLPRSTHPWPSAGKVIRNVSGSVTVVGGSHPGTRTFARRIEVDFPADAQGNVTLKVSGAGVTGTATCSLNLVTRVVSSCTF